MYSFVLCFPIIEAIFKNDEAKLAKNLLNTHTFNE